MGARGPVPKRSTQRRRRNKVAIEAAAASDGVVRGPDLKGTHSAVGRRWYEALRRSGQAQFFEPSDWAAAELVVLAIDEFRKRPSAVMLASIHSMMSSLLTTEGDRRRVQLELERPGDGDDVEEAVVAELEEYRLRLAGD